MEENQTIHKLDIQQKNESSVNNFQPENAINASFNIDSFKIQQYLGLMNPNVDQQNKINFIYNCFSEIGLSGDDISIKLNEIKRKVGATPLNSDTLSQIYQYLKVDREINKMTNLKKSMEI